MIPLVNSKAARPAARGADSWWRGPLRWIVAALALVAFLDAAYLTVTSFSHSTVAGCDATSAAGCDEVLSSTWSRWIFVPVALGGALCYGGIFALSLVAHKFTDEAGRWVGTLLLMLALLAAASAFWFTGVQILALGTYCPYCMVSHACGLVIAGLVLWMYFSRPKPALGASQSFSGIAAIPGGARRPAAAHVSIGPSLGIASGFAGAFVALLVVGQLFLAPQTYQASKPALDESIDLTAANGTATPDEELSPDAQTHVVNRVTDTGSVESEADAAVDDLSPAAAEDGTAESDVAAETKPALSREVKFLNGRMRINMYNEAVLGSPEAKHVVVELMDYTCPHCREMHSQLKRARDRYGNDLAIVVLPVPLEMECNKMVTHTDPMHRGACRMSRLALSVAKLDPSAFADFHNWLLADEEHVPSGVQILNRAWKLVDQRELSKLSNSEEMKKRIERYSNLFSALSRKYSTTGKPFGLPIQIIGDTALTGKFEDDKALREAWDKALGIERAADTASVSVD